MVRSKAVDDAIKDPETRPGVRNAMRHFNAALHSRALEEKLAMVRAHMGACLMQRTASDDALIFEHIQAAYDLAKPGTDWIGPHRAMVEG